MPELALVGHDDSAGLGELRVLVLGPLVVNGPAGPIPLHRDRHCEVIGTLIANRPRPVSIEHLVEVLWGDDAPASAATTVRSYISLIRTALGAPAIETTAGGYVLRTASTDVDEFCARGESALEALARQEFHRAADDSAGALSLWRGPVLGHLGERWTTRHEVAFRTRLEELHRCSHQCLVEARHSLGERETLVPDALHLWRLDHRNEANAVLVANLLAAAGRTADGLRVLHDHREAMAEAGLLAGSRIRETENDLLRPPTSSNRGSRLTTDASPDPMVHGQFPLVGRERSVRDLDRWLNDPSASGAFVVLGEAGIGKTRLLEELEAPSDHRMISTSCASTESHMPWASIAAFVRALIDSAIALPPWARESLSLIVPELGAEPAVDGRADRVIDAVVLLCGMTSEERPLVWKVDDFHWASSHTVNAVERLEGMRSPRLRVLLSTRPVEGGHPGEAVVARCVRVARSTSLSLLQRDDVERLLCQPFESTTPELARLAGALHHATRGHPLYVTMTLHGLLRRGQLARTESGWIGNALDNPSKSLAIPTDDVRTVIEIDLAAVPGQARRGLEILAIADRPLATSVWFDAWPMEDGERDVVLASLQRSSFLRDVDGNSALSHQLVASVLIDALGTAGREIIHQRLVRSLERNERRPDPEECFRHARGANDATRTLSWGVEVAGRFGRSAPLPWIDEVLEQTRSAADCLRDANPVLTLELRRCEMRNAKRAFRIDEAQRAADDVVDAARFLGDTESEIEALHISGDARCEAGELSAGLTILREALAIARRTGSVSAVTVAADMVYFERLSTQRRFSQLLDDLPGGGPTTIRGHVLKDAGHLGAAIAEFSAVVDEAKATSNRRLELFAWINIARTHLALNGHEQARFPLNEARRIADQLGEPALVEDEEANALSCVDPSAAVPRLRACYDAALGDGLEIWAAEIGVVLADAYRRAGLIAEATELGRERESRLGRLVTGTTLWATESTIVATAEFLAGRPLDAMTRLEAIWTHRDRIDATLVLRASQVLVEAADAAGLPDASNGWRRRANRRRADLQASLAASELTPERALDRSGSS